MPSVANPWRALRYKGGQRYSLDELIAVQSATHDAVVSLGYENAVSGIDLESQVVEIEVSNGPSDALSGTLRDQVVAETAAGLLPTNLTVGEFEIIDRPDGPLTTPTVKSYGGSYARDDGVNECTSSFVVRRNTDSVEGVLTAGHCSGVNQHAADGSGTSYTAPWVTEHIGTNGDIEWHTTIGIDDRPEVYTTNTVRMVVKSRVLNSGILLNASFCGYGRWGGADCGWVDVVNINVTFTHDGVSRTAKNMTKGRSWSVINGDSGGPTYKGTQAWGTIHGFWTSNPSYSYFSKICRAPVGRDQACASCKGPLVRVPEGRCH